ncbi:hypothetical protein GL213_12935 [Halogeometricum borinquense]|uniref:Uncharacterized protein n=1 Tax=Halogeometricum borinquense TaxID=60847 RepID=A0A6C0UG45_9EURY|nr:hypothetical protein [Halogeometricum borinquense]QIB73251.1 hypothetical protein G3I44_02505 [Halogeometricum borinquense]QIQ77352.1 hypothetical protein GL213_12935 [Halogeometricum borinquense]
MRRRRFLAAAVSLPLVTGCTQSLDDAAETTTEQGSNPTSTATETETNTSNDVGRPPETFPEERPDWSQVITAETTPRTYALSGGFYYNDDNAAVYSGFTETATANHPARLVFVLQNDNDFANTFRLDEIPPFGRGECIGDGPQDSTDEIRSAGYRTDLVVAPTESHDLASETPDYKRASDGTWRLSSPKSGPWLPKRIRLEADEWVRGEYVLLGRPEGTEYGRPTGRYEFRGRDSGLTLNVWDSEAPGPETESRFAGESVPSLTEQTIAWFHEADATTETFIRPSTEQLSLPGAVEYEFVNHSHTNVGCGHWDLYKLHGGEWFHIFPKIHTADCLLLPPGGTETLSLRAFHGDAVPCGGDNPNAATNGFGVGHLGGGRYAVVTGNGAEAGASGALLDIEADPVTIRPTDDVTAERNSDTVTVTSPRYGDGEHPPDATLTATRADSADETRLPEQVMQGGNSGWRIHGIRNTVPFFADDVNRVVLRTDEHVAESALNIDNDSNTRRLEVDGTAYEFTIERTESD